MVASVGLVVLGFVQTTNALRVAAQADRASALAQISGSVVTLAHEVGAEYVQTNAARRPGADQQPLLEQRARTDAARLSFTRVSGQVRGRVPSLSGFFDAADRTLVLLSLGRDDATQTQPGAAGVSAIYDTIVKTLITLADAFPTQMNDPGLVELSRSMALVAELDYLAGRQLDLLARAFRGEQALGPDDLAQIAQWAGVEQRHVDALANLRPAGVRFGALITGPQVATAVTLRDAVLRSSTDEELRIALAADAAVWFPAQSERQRRLQLLQVELAGTLERQADLLGSAARQEVALTGGLSAAVVALTLTGSAMLAIRTSRRLRGTRYAALTAARIELPTAISNVIAARDATTVRAALTDSWSRIDAMLAAGSDEIGELASAFGAVHRQALRLAADQALLRMEVLAMFVALSRRGQTLVQRQIHLIDEFGRHEVDPEALGRLFALDHLAARMRRNEENLLVLAGGEPSRWITRPAAIVDVVRAAAQEIEDYQRVEVGETPEIALAAHVAGDVIHLLAELLENATSFSPPSTLVRVTVRRTVEGLTLAVFDDGIGMPVERLVEANERLAHPSALTSTLVGTMGLLVVARLAQRHRMQVSLTSVPAGGTAAQVTIPESVLLPYSASDDLHTARWVFEPPAEPAAAAAGSAPHYPAPVLAVTAGPVASAVPGIRPMLLADPAEPAEPVDPAAPAVAQPGPTPAGLPRRGAGAGSAWDAPLDLPPPGPPDPDAVRARLSSLASGFAAANRPEPDPQPAPTRPH